MLLLTPRLLVSLIVSCMTSGAWTTGKMTCAGGGDLSETHLAPPT